MLTNEQMKALGEYIAQCKKTTLIDFDGGALDPIAKLYEFTDITLFDKLVSVCYPTVVKALVRMATQYLALSRDDDRQGVYNAVMEGDESVLSVLLALMDDRTTLSVLCSAFDDARESSDRVGVV